MLVKWGLNRAAENNESVWLISAPDGKRLYQSLGFHEAASGSRFGEPQYVMTLFKSGN